MSKNLFITGTGTDVGKTYVAALMVKALQESGEKAGYYKAAMSGNDRRADGSLIPGDALCVKTVSGISQPLEEMCPYVYENVVSPHLASRLEGNPVMLDTVLAGLHRAEKTCSYLTMEGSGGILCPLCFDELELWLPQVIKACKMSCVMVADAGLGTINYVGLTAAYLKQQGIALKGIIFNHFKPGDVMQQDNIKMCEHLTGVKAVATVQDGDTRLNIAPGLLKSLYE